jgi:hypothetical protein
VIALILAAAWPMGRKAVRSWPTAILAVAGLAAGVVHVNAVWTLLVAGAAVLLWPSGIGSSRALELLLLALGLLVRWRWHPAFVLAIGVVSAMLGWVP